MWTLSNEDVGAENEEQKADDSEIIANDDLDIFSPKDLISVSEANRPSMDQMLPTRYSELLLDSHRQSKPGGPHGMMSPVSVVG